YNLAVLSVIDLQSEPAVPIPDKLLLKANYPNPFNPSTTIRFGLPRAAEYSLRVYDQLGRIVGIIDEGFRNAGEFDVEFRAAGLSSGIYYYVLRSGGAVEVRPMVLVK
ncbi:MAG: T9SS type A sorting domain-containing protein, partial [Bacteroidota bacterium]